MNMHPYLSGVLKARLASAEPLGVIWLALGHPSVAELAARAGADALVIDLQHGLWDRAALEAATGLAAPHVPVVARVAENSPHAIGSALDAGVDGVLVPMVETAEQAAAAVAAARFPPAGNRSGGGIRPLAMGFAAYLEKADAVAVGVMIETARGVANAAAIAAVPGVDFVFIGTGDLSVSCAADGGGAAETEAACAAVQAACRAAGVPCGIFTPGIGKALERRRQGYRLVVLAGDVDAVNDTFLAAVERYGKDA